MYECLAATAEYIEQLHDCGHRCGKSGHVRDPVVENRGLRVKEKTPMPTPSTTKDVCSILARIPAPCLSQCLLLLRGIAPVKKCAKRQSLMLIKPQRCPTKPGFISSRITPRLFALITPSWANCTRASFCAFEVAGQQPVVVGPPKFGFQTRQRFHRRAARGSNSSRSGPTTVTSFATALVPVAMNSTIEATTTL